jgi:transposase InsO family protein
MSLKRWTMSAAKRTEKGKATTDSRHSLPVFRNLVKDLELDGPNQAWVADITCIRTDEGFLYLSLLMDRWSRKIVGYHGGDTLEAEGALRARNMALASLPAGASPIHHSNRGCQYCSHRYVEKLRAIDEAVALYNTRRPHAALDFETPETMYRRVA